MTKKDGLDEEEIQEKPAEQNFYRSVWIFFFISTLSCSMMGYQENYNPVLGNPYFGFIYTIWEGTGWVIRASPDGKISLIIFFTLYSLLAGVVIRLFEWRIRGIQRKQQSK